MGFQSSNPDAYQVIQELRNYVRYMESLGVSALPRVTTPQIAPAIETLEDLRRLLGDCQRCPLCQSRRNIVFGQGPEKTDLMFVGEGPDSEEDNQGRPFVGPAGSLLTDIIVKGMKRRREDCYIANVVKCRPPQSRAPLPHEAGTCLPFLKSQIEIIQPKVIVALGRTAAQYLLETSESLSRLRHRFSNLGQVKVMPTFHPVYLLEHPENKKETWQDIKLVISYLNEDRNHQ